MQTVTARHPDAARLRSGRLQASGLASGVMNTSYQVGLALHFAAAVAGVAVLLPLDAIRRPIDGGRALAVDQPLLERIA